MKIKKVLIDNLIHKLGGYTLQDVDDTYQKAYQVGCDVGALKALTKVNVESIKTSSMSKTNNNVKIKINK